MERLPHQVLPAPEPLEAPAATGRLTPAGLSALLRWTLPPRPAPHQWRVVVRAVDDLPPGVYAWDGGRTLVPLAGPSRPDVIPALTRRAAALVFGVESRQLDATSADSRVTAASLGVVAAALAIRAYRIDDVDGQDVDALLHLTPDEVVVDAFALCNPGDEGSPIEARRCWSSRPSMLSVPELAELPLWSGAESPPGLGALRATQDVLGLRLFAELPGDLQRLRKDLWPAYPRVRRLAESGRPIHWHWTAPEHDEAHLYGCRVSLAGAMGSGAHPFCARTAFERATGEAVERHVALGEPLAADKLRVAPSSELGDSGLPLDGIAGYARGLREADTALTWSRDTPFAWVQARSLTDGRSLWVPAQLVGRLRHPEPELAPRVTTGLAAHPDRSTALLHGLLEVVERDAFMLTWLTRSAPTRLELDATEDTRAATLVARIEAARLDASAFLLETDVPVAVVLAVVHDPTGVGPAVAVGAAARCDAGAAVLDALTEALVAWRWSRRLGRDGGMRPVDPAQLGPTGRLLWWAPAERWDDLDWLFGGKRAGLPRIEGPEPEAAGELGRLLAWFGAVRVPVLAVDLTDEMLAHRLGHHVVRVIVPGFHPLHLDESRPAHWSERLRQRRNRPGSPDEIPLNLTPHPFP